MVKRQLKATSSVKLFCRMTSPLMQNNFIRHEKCEKARNQGQVDDRWKILTFSRPQPTYHNLKCMTAYMHTNTPMQKERNKKEACHSID